MQNREVTFQPSSSEHIIIDLNQNRIDAHKNRSKMRAKIFSLIGGAVIFLVNEKQAPCSSSITRPPLADIQQLQRKVATNNNNGWPPMF